MWVGTRHHYRHGEAGQVVQMICEICDKPIKHQVQVADSKGIHVFCSIPCSERWVRQNWNRIIEVGYDKTRHEWVCTLRSGDTARLPFRLFTALVATCPELPYHFNVSGDLQYE